MNFLKTSLVFCNDNVNKWLYKVHCLSGVFNDLGDPAGGTVTLAFPTSALSFGAIQNSIQLTEFNSAEASGDELSIRIVLIVDVLKDAKLVVLKSTVCIFSWYPTVFPLLVSQVSNDYRNMKSSS